MELIRLLDCIPSKKTQIAVIEMIGPRLTDPKKCSNEILNRFRFAEEKQTVQDILKARAVTQNSGLYATKKPLGGPGRHSPKKKTNEIPATHQHSTTDLQSESDQSKPQEVVHLVPEMQFVSVTQDVPSIDDCNITIEITSPEISKYEESTSSLQGRETGSAVTTNEDLDNMIADREEIKLCERSTCLENSAPENLREVEQPDLVGSRNEYATPLDSNSSVPVTTPPLDIVKKIDESSRSDPNIHLYHDSPVINVVPKTRMLSIHHANVSRHGSENEFLTQTDEFSFDERFHSTSAFVEEPRIPTEPPSKILVIIFFTS